MTHTLNLYDTLHYHLEYEAWLDNDISIFSDEILNRILDDFWYLFLTSHPTSTAPPFYHNQAYSDSSGWANPRELTTRKLT